MTESRDTVLWGEPFVTMSFVDFFLVSRDPSPDNERVRFCERSEISVGGGSDFAGIEGTRLMFGVPGPEYELSGNTFSAGSPVVDL